MEREKTHPRYCVFGRIYGSDPRWEKEEALRDGASSDGGRDERVVLSRWEEGLQEGAGHGASFVLADCQTYCHQKFHLGQGYRQEAVCLEPTFFQP